MCTVALRCPPPHPPPPPRLTQHEALAHARPARQGRRRDVRHRRRSCYARGTCVRCDGHACAHRAVCVLRRLAALCARARGVHGTQTRPSSPPTCGADRRPRPAAACAHALRHRDHAVQHGQARALEELGQPRARFSFGNAHGLGGLDDLVHALLHDRVDGVAERPCMRQGGDVAERPWDGMGGGQRGAHVRELWRSRAAAAATPLRGRQSLPRVLPPTHPPVGERRGDEPPSAHARRFMGEPAWWGRTSIGSGGWMAHGSAHPHHPAAAALPARPPSPKLTHQAAPHRPRLLAGLLLVLRRQAGACRCRRVRHGRCRCRVARRCNV